MNLTLSYWTCDYRGNQAHRFAKNLNKHLEPFRARRAELASKPDYVADVLNDGAKRARAIAQETMREVREAMALP